MAGITQAVETELLAITHDASLARLFGTSTVGVLATLLAEARPVLASWVVLKGPPALERDILRAKQSARAHTGAPHCGSHCHQLGVCLTPHFFVAGPAAGGRLPARYLPAVAETGDGEWIPSSRQEAA